MNNEKTVCRTSGASCTIKKKFVALSARPSRPGNVLPSHCITLYYYYLFFNTSGICGVGHIDLVVRFVGGTHPNTDKDTTYLRPAARRDRSSGRNRRRNGFRVFVDRKMTNSTGEIGWSTRSA